MNTMDTIWIATENSRQFHLKVHRLQHEKFAACLTFDAQDSVLKAAKMLSRIANIDFVAK